MSMPSITAWGLPSTTDRSMNAPGSPSSALQIRYLAGPGALIAMSHFVPVGNPAPPRPRSLDDLDHLLRGHRREHLSGGLISLAPDIGIDVLGVHLAAVRQHDFDL